MVEAGRQFGTTLAIEHNLARAYVTVSHALIMHEVEGAQHLPSQMFEDGLGNGSDRLLQVVQAAIGGVVLHN